jgi:hypothetical protein
LKLNHVFLHEVLDVIGCLVASRYLDSARLFVVPHQPWLVAEPNECCGWDNETDGVLYRQLAQVEKRPLACHDSVETVVLVLQLLLLIDLSIADGRLHPS